MQSRIVFGTLLSLTLVLAVTASTQANSIGITFGDGTQAGAGGPVVATATWNNVAVEGTHQSGADFLGWFCSRDGIGPLNNYWSGWAADIATVDGAGTSLTNPITLLSYDPGAYTSLENYGGLPWWTTGSTGNSAAYATQKFTYSTANQYGQTASTTITISNIPYTSYTLYVGGSGLWLNGTEISGDAVFSDLSAASLVFSTVYPNPGDGARGSLSYLQFVEAGGPPVWPDYLPGDFNKDGEVGPEDFGILKDNFGLDSLPFGAHESWTLGDANDDGEIGPEDFGMLKDSFGLDGGPTGTYPLSNVPEPTTLALLALAGLAIRRKQR